MKNPLVALFKTKASGDAAEEKVSVVPPSLGPNVEVTHLDGMTIYEMKPEIFEGFRLFIDAINGGYDQKSLGDTLAGVEDRLGFKFPGGVPQNSEHFTGIAFSGKPAITLPAGWSYKQDEHRKHILDDQGRIRGWIDRNDRVDDRMSMSFTPRYTFDHDIIASRKFRDGNSLTLGSFWMSSVTSEWKDVLPCFIYVNPMFWPVGDCDFTRLEKELTAVGKADVFIAQQTKKMFPGAVIKAGTETVNIGGGLSMGIDLHGDVFAHWDEADAEERLEKLRVILEAEVPRILGSDNSLILATFPAADDIAALKTSVPDWTAPPPQKWQGALYWADRNVKKMLGREPS